jgi:hypothetical protein
MNVTRFVLVLRNRAGRTLASFRKFACIVFLFITSPCDMSLGEVYAHSLIQKTTTREKT